MEREAGVQKIRELMKGVGNAMLTTVEEDGSLRSRPMALQQADYDGDLWFFTSANSPKIHLIEREPHVNVSFSSNNTWVSLSGRASLVRDRAKIEALWHDELKAWFAQGLNDPNIALLKVSADYGEYWDTPSNAAVRLFGYAKAKLTGKEYSNEMTDHEKVAL